MEMRGVLFDELGFYLVVVVVDMGCGGSKADELPLVALSRQRKELIRAAADHRYALAAAHVAYFTSLKDVGDALRRFVEEEIVISSTSSPDSPVLTLPSDEGKKSTKKTGKSNIKSLSSTSTSLSHSGSISHNHDHDHDHDDHHYHHDHDMDEFHLHLSSDSDSGPESGSGHIHIHDSPENERRTYSPQNQTAWGSYGVNPETNWGSYGYNPPPQAAWGSYESNFPHQTAWNSNDSIPPPQTHWGSYELNQPPQTNWGSYGSNQPFGGSSNTYAYYMKKSAPVIRTVIHPEEQRMQFGGQWGEQPYSYSSTSYQNENGGYFGMRSPPVVEKRPPPPAPPSPQVSAWDFFNPFDAYDNGYSSYYSQNRYNQGSVASSPDSNEVRLREGIPPLEEETETETDREVHKGKSLNEEDRRQNTHKGSVPLHKNEGKSRASPSHPVQNSDDNPESSEREHFEDVNGEDKEGKGSPNSIVSSTSIEIEEEDYVKKKGVSFEVEMSNHEVDSSGLSSLTTLSVHGTRDLQEAVTEIRDEFEIASSFGKEVAVMLEVGKLPYKPKLTLQVIISRILYLISPSLSPMDPPLHSVRLNSRTMKIAKSYFEDNGKGANLKHINLSSTLEKLYAWEKKLHKEIKDEEKLRVNYEKMCRNLKILDERGADHSKIEATQASIRSLVTKLDVSINAIDAISTRIHKLRDQELEPQVTELIHGLIRMWQSMLKCHQKQFQAIKESKLQKLKANTALRTDSSLTATKALETELLAWSTHFNDWVTAQKLYVKSLSEWLNHFLNREPIETSDGLAPFSPSRIGAPPIFVICHDWADAMDAVHESGVKRAMHSFASDVHRLYERQDNEHRQRVRAEHLSKDFASRVSKGKVKGKKKTGRADGSGSGSIVASDNGVSPLDDLKVDLDLIRKKLEEERAKHKDAVKLVHDAASSSLQGGLVPIFKSLENFTAEALRAHEQVRIEVGRGEVS